MPKTWDKREDGYIWWGSHWYSPEAVQRIVDARKRNRKKLNEKNRKYYAKTKARWNERAKLWKQKNKEKCRSSYQKYYTKHREEIVERTKRWGRENKEKRKAAHLKYQARNNPTYGLTRAISDYRRGKISGDELAQRLRDAFARGDELCERIEHGGKPGKPKL